MAMMDSGISDVSSEVSTVSVSEEIRRFQQEIDAAAVGNVKYPGCWKQQRLGEKLRSVNGESLIDSDSGSEQQGLVDLPPKRGSILLAPKLPPRRKNCVKSVSFTANEVRVLGTVEELPTHLPATEAARSRQIQPSTYFAPIEPPVINSDESYNSADTPDDVHDDLVEDEDVPVLPSVRQLTRQFQILRPSGSEPSVATKQDRVEKVAAMLRINKQGAAYNQVHSITARSVSRQFRESLKIGKAELTDDIFKLPEAKQNTRTQDTVKSRSNVKANIVYQSSTPQSLFPHGDYIRNYGTEGSGLAEDGNSSDSQRRW